MAPTARCSTRTNDDPLGELIHEGPDSVTWAVKFVRDRMPPGCMAAINQLPEGTPECTAEVQRMVDDHDYTVRIGPYRIGA